MSFKVRNFIYNDLIKIITFNNVAANQGELILTYEWELRENYYFEHVSHALAANFDVALFGWLLIDYYLSTE